MIRIVLCLPFLLIEVRCCWISLRLMTAQCTSDQSQTLLSFITIKPISYHLSPSSLTNLTNRKVKLVDSKENSSSTADQQSTKTPKVAICLSGGLRSFYRPIIHETLLHNAFNALAPPEDRDVFVTASADLQCYHAV
jgi:hypothetical protein